MPLLKTINQGDGVFENVSASSYIYIYDNDENKYYNGKIDITDENKIIKSEITPTPVSTLIGFLTDELEQAGYPISEIRLSSRTQPNLSQFEPVELVE